MRLALPRGLRPRLVVAFLLVAALSALITSALTFRQARSAILDRTQNSAVQDLRLQVDSLVANLPPDPTDTDLRTFTRQLDLASGSQGRHTAVSRDGGSLIGTADGIGNVLRAAAKNGTTTFYERVEDPGGPRLLIGMPVDSTDRRTGAGKPSGLVVYAVLSLHAEQADISALITAAWAGAVPALAAAVAPALFAARRVLRPVRQLRTAAERITSGPGHAPGRRRQRRTRRADRHVQHHGCHVGAGRRRTTAYGGQGPPVRRRRLPRAAHPARRDDGRHRRLDEDARSGTLPPDAAEAVLLISDETRKLAVMVEDLMEISRFDAGAAVLDLDDVSLRTVIHKTLQLRGWREPDEVITELPEADPRIRIDARRIDVVLANLISNALRHGAAPVVVRATATPGAVVIEVADHGPGIPDDALPHIFDRFHKADAARTRSEGSGLGLAIARENVRLHHGTLFAANLPEGGAVFTLTLPNRHLQEDPP